MGFAVDGIIAYKSTLANKKVFQETERTKVSHYVFITQYGGYGIRLMLIPASMSVLFNNSTVFNELISNVDTGERLNIYTPFKGKNLFSEKSSGYMDFSGIIIIIGAILALLYGYDALQNAGYFKFISNFAGFKKVIAYVLIVRLILINTFFLLLTALSLLIILMVGINLVNFHFIYFVFKVLLVITFFTCFGFFTGTLKRKALQVMVMIVFYLCFILFIPWTVNKIVSIRANGITSNYKMELEKLKIMMAFERKFYEQIGIFNSKEIADEKVKKLIEEVLNNEYKKFEDYENKMKHEMIDNIRSYQKVSSLFPTTYYVSSNYELSSKGYLNVIDYYAYNQSIKKQFIDFYVKKKFYSKIDRIESFIKGDMNLFYSKSRVMDGWWKGIFLTILYIFVLLISAYIRLKNAIYITPRKEPGGNQGIEILLRMGEEICIHTDKNTTRHFFNLLSGKPTGFPGKISLDGINIVKREKKDFVYLCSPQALPVDITPAALVTFLKTLFNLSEKDLIDIKKGIRDDILKKKFGDIGAAQKVRILFNAALLKKAPLFLFDDFFNNLPRETIKGFEQELKALKQNGGLLLYMTTTSFEYIPVSVDRYAKIYLDNDKYVYKEFSRNKKHDCP
jgi:ABC-type transport system involved in cytochrome c biogenesis ATPase subunit